MLIEPTESESLRELDRFCDAMIAIRKEADAIASGEQPRDGNILRRAPHPITSVVSDTWDRPYSREAAAYPDSRLRRNKMWPSTSRIDDAWGDRKCVRARRTVRLTCSAWSASARPSRTSPSPERIPISHDQLVPARSPSHFNVIVPGRPVMPHQLSSSSIPVLEGLNGYCTCDIHSISTASRPAWARRGCSR